MILDIDVLDGYVKTIHKQGYEIKRLRNENRFLWFLVTLFFAVFVWRLFA